MQASPDDIDVAAMWTAVKRGLPRVLIAAAIVGALTYGVLTLVSPSYKSTAQIILESSSSSLLRPSGEVGTGSDLKIDENEVASQAEVIRSHDLLSKVVAEQHLGDVPEFNPALQSLGLFGHIAALMNGTPGGRDAYERALNMLALDVRVGEVPKTRLINIDVTTHDAKRSADLANAIAQAYLDRNRSAQVQNASEATTSIGASIAQVKKEAEAAEAELERFRAEAGLLSGQNKVTLNNQQLSELNTQLTQATAARTEAEARSKILRQMIASGTVEASQDVVKSPNMQQLFQQKLRVERDIAELSATLLPGHPRMRQLAGELAIANQSLRNEAKQVAAGIEDDLKVASARETALQDSIARLTEAAAKSSDAQAKLSSLEREVQSKRNTYDGLLQRLNEASSRRTNSAVSAMAELNQRAVAASVPDSPKKAQMSVFAMLATLLLGLVWLIGRALIGGGAAARPFGRRASDARPVEAGTTARLSGNSALAGFIREATAKDRGARILLTGETASQDILASATALAGRLAAADSDVLLVDLVSASDPGLADLVAGKVTFEDVVRAEPGQRWHRIAAGSQAVSARSQTYGNLELIFEVMTASYRNVVVCANRAEAKTLLEALAGRIDIGVVCAATGRSASAPIEQGFLGYDVEAMALAWLDTVQSPAKVVLSRLSAVRPGRAAA